MAWTALCLLENIIPCGLYDGLGFYEDFPSDRSCFADAVISAGIEFIGHDIGTNGKRLPEIGVRKAFGATSCVLFSQIIWENLILTVIGGCLGLIISYGMVLLSKNWLLTLLDDNVAALPDGVGVSITPQMLFSPVLFMAAFLICVVINLFSAVIPAYLSLRKDIVYSINKQK